MQTAPIHLPSSGLAISTFLCGIILFVAFLVRTSQMFTIPSSPPDTSSLPLKFAN